MTSTLYALPLDKGGESFLLRTCRNRDDFNILVDAGDHISAPGNTLAKVIAAAAPDVDRINRLILTHEDLDHVGGAAQFIKEWISNGNSIHQAWLPALWLAADGAGRRDGWHVADLLQGAFEAAPEIQAAIDKVSGEIDADDAEGHNHVSLEVGRLVNYIRDDDADLAQVMPGSAELDKVLRPLEGEEPEPEGSPLEAPPEDAPRPPWLWDVSTLVDDREEVIWQLARRFPSVDQRHAELAVALAIMVIQTHAQIAPAIDACRRHKIRIRWFDFLWYKATMLPKGGDRGFLTPVNAVELVPTRKAPSPKAMFYALFLTQANRESLVYFRHETGGEPAALFTADSRLKVGHKSMTNPTPRPLVARLLMTAPHHASKSNAPAYAVVRKWLTSTYPPIIVQNGGRRVTKAAEEFKAVRDHFCVLCVGSGALPGIVKPKIVKVATSNGEWRVPNRTRACTCR
jgi:hypothetical protein